MYITYCDYTQDQHLRINHTIMIVRTNVGIIYQLVLVVNHSFDHSRGEYNFLKTVAGATEHMFRCGTQRVDSGGTLSSLRLRDSSYVTR